MLLPLLTLFFLFYFLSLLTLERAWTLQFVSLPLSQPASLISIIWMIPMLVLVIIGISAEFQFYT